LVRRRGPEGPRGRGNHRGGPLEGPQGVAVGREERLPLAITSMAISMIT